MRTLDFFLIAAILLLSVTLWGQHLTIQADQLRYQMDSNYTSQLNECITGIARHDWMFDVSGITKSLKKQYPGAFR